MKELIYESHGESDTARLGAALADAVPDGAVLALSGTLGAGKTRLVQALAAACGIDPKTVVSPTFVLVQEHEGWRKLFHFDAYRLRDRDEFLALGPEEYFEAGGIVAIEWANRVTDCLPDERLEIEIEVTGPASRRFRIRGVGETMKSTIERLQAWCEDPTQRG